MMCHWPRGGNVSSVIAQSGKCKRLLLTEELELSVYTDKQNIKWCCLVVLVCLFFFFPPHDFKLPLVK